MFIGLSLGLTARLMGGVSAYAVAGLEPELVLDFATDTYRVDGSAATFSSAVTYSGTGLRTMVDSDGLLKWAPHNLLTRSNTYSTGWNFVAISATENAASDPDGGGAAVKFVESATTATHYTRSPSVTVVSGATYGFSVWLKAAERSIVAIQGDIDSGRLGNPCVVDLSDGSIVSTGAGVSSFSVTSAGDGWYICTGTAVATASPVVMGVSPRTTSAAGLQSYAGDGASGFYAYGFHLYRSDLGGMVNNPDRGDSYVPTTTAAVYMPRRGNHVYNGTSWVNRGLLLESEARENLLTYSQDFANAAWTMIGAAVTANATGPDGVTNSAFTLGDVNFGGTANVGAQENFTVATSTAYTFSVFAKADQLNFLALQTVGFTSPANGFVWFDLSSGAVGTENTGLSGAIEDVGSGWYRCAMTFTTDAADTSGDIRIRPAEADNQSLVDSDGTSSILIYGAQFEAGSVPSSYIPTNGSTVTRAAETATVAAANMPWPTPNVIGAELVTNGTFDTDTDWTKGTGWAITGGEAVATGVVVGEDLVAQGLTLEAGKVYQISYDVTSFSSGGVSAEVGSVALTARNGVGSYTEIHVPAANGDFKFIRRLNTFTGTIDNVSVREIDPLAVSIQMDGDVSYIDDGDNATAMFTRWYAGSTAYHQLRLRTDSTRTGAVYSIMHDGAAIRGQDTSGTATDLVPGVNVAFNGATRFGSNFLNVALNGIDATVTATPVALPDLSSTNFEIGYDFMGNIGKVRVWAADLGDAGIEEASA